jgi:hypothetical protein
MSANITKKDPFKNHRYFKSIWSEWFLRLNPFTSIRNYLIRKSHMSVEPFSFQQDLCSFKHVVVGMPSDLNQFVYALELVRILRHQKKSLLLLIPQKTAGLVSLVSGVRTLVYSSDDLLLDSPFTKNFSAKITSFHGDLCLILNENISPLEAFLYASTRITLRIILEQEHFAPFANIHIKKGSSTKNDPFASIYNAFALERSIIAPRKLLASHCGNFPSISANYQYQLTLDLADEWFHTPTGEEYVRSLSTICFSNHIQLIIISPTEKQPSFQIQADAHLVWTSALDLLGILAHSSQVLTLSPITLPMTALFEECHVYSFAMQDTQPTQLNAKVMLLKPHEIHRLPGFIAQNAKKA